MYSAGHVLNGKYEVLGRVAEADGEVYRGWQRPQERLVALRVVRVEGETSEQRAAFRKGFLLSASLCMRLQHPNVVAVFDYGRTDDEEERYFVALEHVEGETLERRLRAHPGGLEAAEAVRIAGDVARALREAHDKGVVHRGLRASSVVLAAGPGGVEQVKVQGFGQPLGGEGGPGADPRDDLQALGVLLFEALTGATPEEPSSKATTARLRRGREVSEALESLVGRLLQPNPAARPGSADEVLAELRSVPEARAVEVRVSSARPEVGGSEGPELKSTVSYRLRRQLSRSARAQVYEGVRVEHERRVAIKVFSPHSEREATRLRRSLPGLFALRSPRNVRTLDAGQGVVGGRVQLYVVMEYLEGKTLGELLQESGKLAPGRAFELVGQVLEGLSELHELGLMHHDLSPEHVLVTRGLGRREHVKLLSPKLSALEVASGPQEGADALGVLSRMAPEVLEGGAPTVQADIYAVGALLFECLTGRAPLDQEQFDRCLREERLPSPVPLREVTTALPEPVVELVERAMAAEPGRRFTSAASMDEAMGRVGSLRPVR